MFKVSTARSALLIAVVLTAACTVKETDIPSRAGPSELALSITIEALPNRVTRNGVDRSTIVVTARDSQGSPAPSVQLRVDSIVLEVVQDFGTVSSAHTIFSGTDGRATTVYTASPAPPAGVFQLTDLITIRVTPVGVNFQTSVSQTAQVRLVLPTVVSPPGSPSAVFTFSTPTAKAVAMINFDASGSFAVGGKTLVDYDWSWGDGEPNGKGVLEEHDWVVAGTYFVVLTVTDGAGQQARSTQLIRSRRSAHGGQSAA